MPWLTKNLLRENSSTQKRKVFRRFLVVEVAERLAPFNAETPKSGEKTRFWAGSDYSIYLKERGFVMFCKYCGKEISETFKLCPFCGGEIKEEDIPHVEATLFQAPPQVTQQQTKTEDVANLGGFKVLGFFLGLFGPGTAMLLPIVSLILYMLWRSDKPKTASAIGRFTVIGLILGFILLIVTAIISAILFAFYASTSIISYLSNFFSFI